MVAVSRHLPQLMAVLSDCCAVLGTWCHLCTGYFRKGMDVDWDADPLNSPLLLRMLAVGSGLPVSPAHTQLCYTDSFSPIPRTCSLHAWPRLALSIPKR